MVHTQSPPDPWGSVSSSVVDLAVSDGLHGHFQPRETPRLQAGKEGGPGLSA